MKPSEKRRRVRKAVAAESPAATRLANRIWELAEPPLHEEQSSKLLADYLAGRGFRVTFPFKSVPTAFKATWGRGRPLIGLLAEYDALPDCGLEPGTYGHGCGHNLLGVAAAAGAVAAARLLDAARRPGRVVCWGCPAEEALAGKVYMARDGAFRGLDACLAWHPASETRVHAAGGAALDSLVFEFHGQTAHAAGGPDRGRSALDAAILMDVAANYLREHVPENVRIHAVLRQGGNFPNVVPEYAKLWYFTRGQDRKQVDDVTRRLRLCAKGAALATETRVAITRLSGLYSRLRNEALAVAVFDNLVLLGAPRVTGDDLKNARKIIENAAFETEVNPEMSTVAGRASSDEDNVSWLAPLGRFNMACVAKGTRDHHREYTAQTRLPFAHRGMLRAAEVFAATAWDLCANAALLRSVRAEFEKGTKGFRYDPLITPRQRPPFEGV